MADLSSNYLQDVNDYAFPSEYVFINKETREVIEIVIDDSF